VLSAVADPAVAGNGKSISGTVIKLRSRYSAIKKNNQPSGLRMFISLLLALRTMCMIPTITSGVVCCHRR
jgi:hypothetical protein